MTVGPGGTKVCPRCGRAFAGRRKWARDWERVTYCSRSCRLGRLTVSDRALEAAIVGLLRSRAAGTSICPSEAARAVEPRAWRPLMEPARRAARRLVAAGRAEITQGGRRVDPGTARGPIRVRLVPGSAGDRPDPERPA